MREREGGGRGGEGGKGGGREGLEGAFIEFTLTR